MRNDSDISMRWPLAFVAAIITAFALAYMTHAEWGLSRLMIRDNALGAAGLLVIVISTRIAFPGKRKGS